MSKELETNVFNTGESLTSNRPLKLIYSPNRYLLQAVLMSQIWPPVILNLNLVVVAGHSASRSLTSI